MWLSLSDHNHWGLSFCVWAYLYFAAFYNILPLPSNVSLHNPRTLRWLSLQLCSPALAQHSKELPNSKLRLLRNGLGWGFSTGASSNWQTHILFMGMSRKSRSQKWEWHMSEIDHPSGRTLWGSDSWQGALLKVTSPAVYWTFKLCSAQESCAKCILIIILFDLHNLARPVFFPQIMGEDTWGRTPEALPYLAPVSS